MRSNLFIGAVCGLITVLCPFAFGQGTAADDPVRVLVGRLELERYKATIKSLTEFGDRRQGTDRNRAAIDWIERQLKSFGCNTARIKYEYNAPEPQFRLKNRAPIPVASGEIRAGSGGARIRGIAVPTGVNDDPEAQPDAKLRELDSQPSTPGPREEVYCTKIGATRPDEMYLISAHMDGIGWGEAADDDGSGTALDMVLFDHGMPRADGTLGPEQRPEADVNVEFQSTAKFSDQAMRLAFFFRDANEKYATDYPAAVGHHMTNTDSTPFMDLVPAISVRENERGMQIGAGWNPHWHQPTDRYSTYSDKDFRLGLNAAQTTLAAIARLAGAALKK